MLFLYYLDGTKDSATLTKQSSVISNTSEAASIIKESIVETQSTAPTLQKIVTQTSIKTDDGYLEEFKNIGIESLPKRAESHRNLTMESLVKNLLIDFKTDKVKQDAKRKFANRTAVMIDEGTVRKRKREGEGRRDDNVYDLELC